MRGWLAVACAVLVAACGRIGFSPETEASSDAAVADDGAVEAVAWVKVFTLGGNPTGSTVDTIDASADHVGDAVVFHVYCSAPTEPTGVSIAAAGWTFSPLSALTGSVGHSEWGASFGAIAPDTSAHSFVVTWSVASCGSGLVSLADEFTDNDPTGGGVTFSAAVAAYGTGDCATVLAPGRTGDMVWGGCTAHITAMAPGFTESCDDGGGDWTGYRVTTDAAATVQTMFANPPGNDFVLTAAVIRHR